MFEFLIPLLAPFIVPLGISAGVLGILLYLPQIIRAHHTKSTMDIANGTYIMILINDITWTLYGLGTDNQFVYIPNGISIGLCITILLQKSRYDTRTRNLR